MKIGRILVLALVVSTAPATADAQGYIGLGLGPTVNMDSWPTQFRIEEEVGYYFDGKRGFFLGFAPWQSWGADFWVISFGLRLGGMFDIFRNDDVTFQMGPTGTLEFALSDHFSSGRDVDPWFLFSVAFMMRLLLLDEVLAVYLRPLGFDFAFSDSPAFGNEAIRYVLVGGVQYYF